MNSNGLFVVLNDSGYLRDDLLFKWIFHVSFWRKEVHCQVIVSCGKSRSLVPGQMPLYSAINRQQLWSCISSGGLGFVSWLQQTPTHWWKFAIDHKVCKLRRNPLSNAVKASSYGRCPAAITQGLFHCLFQDFLNCSFFVKFCESIANFHQKMCRVFGNQQILAIQLLLLVAQARQMASCHNSSNSDKSIAAPDTRCSPETPKNFGRYFVQLYRKLCCLFVGTMFVPAITFDCPYPWKSDGVRSSGEQLSFFQNIFFLCAVHMVSIMLDFQETHTLGKHGFISLWNLTIWEHVVGLPEPFEQYMLHVWSFLTSSDISIITLLIWVSFQILKWYYGISSGNNSWQLGHQHLLLLIVSHLWSLGAAW